jgi:hypothetical protein
MFWWSIVEVWLWTSCEGRRLKLTFCSFTWFLIQSNTDNRTPDNRKISISSHIYVQILNIEVAWLIKKMFRPVRLLGLIRYPAILMFGFRIWSSGYRISGNRPKWTFDNQIRPDIGVWLYSTRSLHKSYRKRMPLLASFSLPAPNYLDYGCC